MTLRSSPLFDRETIWRMGLIGDPIAHSLSPSLHEAAFRSHGLCASYELWPTSEADLPARLAGLRRADVLGANVTMPHKLAVTSLLDEISPLSARAGAVNTIMHRDGRLIGDNTDVEGFTTALTSAISSFSERHILVLGAGGAARAVVLGLQALGTGQVTIANRSSERAETLAATFSSSHQEIGTIALQKIAENLETVSVLVNATAAGWRPGETPIPLDVLDNLPANAWVVDLTFRETDLLRAARQRGLSTLDGLPMLVHQAAGAFTRWTGLGAPVAEMLEAGENARVARR